MKMRNWPLDDLLLVAKHKLFHSDIISYVMVGDEPVKISNYGLSLFEAAMLNLRQGFVKMRNSMQSITVVFEDFGKTISEAMNPLLAQEDVVD